MYQQPYGFTPPPRRRRGLKRTIFGGLGVLANAAGLIVMPLLIGLIGGLISMGTSQTLTGIDPHRATFDGDAMRVYSLAVPAEYAATVDCRVTSGHATISPQPTDYPVGTVEGTEYYDAFDLTVNGSGEISLECTGTESLALWEAGMGGMLLSIGIGFVVPVVLGALSLALLIWGIVALIRSAG